MNNNNKLTRFDEGGLHSQNPNGGIKIGDNASVEQGETLKNNFVYSNRIFLDSNVVSQYNLPKSLVGKSVADATKFIDDKFKGRNDKISQSTKNGMLSKIAEAQEAMKPQEPEVEQSQEGMEQQGQQDIQQPNQMWDGGFKQSTIGQGFGAEATGAQQSQAIGAGLGIATTALDLGNVAFGKPTQNTDGLAASTEVNKVGMIGGSAIKGATAGMAFGPAGAGIGALIGAGAGLLGTKKAEKAAVENTNNFALNTNRKYSDQYAFGGIVDPTKKITTDTLLNTPIVTGVKPSSQSDRFRYAVGEQGGVQHGSNGELGHYLYYDKKPGDAGFNPNIHREFVNQGGYDTYMKSPQGQQYRSNLQLQPKQMAGGGPLDETFKVKQNLYPQEIQNLKPDNSITDSSVLKQYNNDLLNPGLYNTQKSLDGDRYSLENRLGRFGTAVNDNLGNLARYAPIAANALQLAQLKKPNGERLDRLSNRYKPEYVDEAQLQNIANQTMNNTVNAVSQSGASQGQLRSSIIGSQLQRTKAISDAYSQAAAQNRQQNAMAQEFNLGVDQTNLGQSTLEKDINARDQAAYRNAKREYITGIGEGIGDIGKEQTYKKIIAKTTGYKWDGEYVKSPDGTVVTDPATGKPMTEEKLKEIQSIKDKKALGGYLIKNKVK